MPGSTDGTEVSAKSTQITECMISKIRSDLYSQRAQIEGEDFDALCGSIRRVGILVPLIVRPHANGYVLLAGHRRLEAAKRIGLSTVPCLISDTDDIKSLEVSFAENFFRTDLSPVELASAIRDVVSSGACTVDQVAEGFRHHPDWVRRQIALCDWPAEVLEAIHYRKLSVSAAANLACIRDDIYRAFLLRNACENGATARTTAAWLQAWEAMQPAEEAVKAEPIPPGQVRIPMVPQAPCIMCSTIYRTDELSHVPVCAACIRRIQGSVR